MKGCVPVVHHLRPRNRIGDLGPGIRSNANLVDHLRNLERRLYPVNPRLMKFIDGGIFYLFFGDAARPHHLLR